MCELGFHNCPACQEEYKCDQPNSECPTMNHYDGPCNKCEYWIDESEREAEREEERNWQRAQWIKDHGWDY